jgi:hypothetical protein
MMSVEWVFYWLGYAGEYSDDGAYYRDDKWGCRSMCKHDA